MSLVGQSVIVTRAPGDAGEIAHLLRIAGAMVHEIPAIQIEAIPSAAREARRHIEGAHWVVFTSAHGVDVFRRDVANAGGNWPARCQLAVVGEATAAAALAAGFPVHFMPTEFTTERLAEELPLPPGSRVLLLRALQGNPVLPERLRQRGAAVTDIALYDTLPHPGLPTRLAGVDLSSIDWVTFTSPTAVEAFDDALPTAGGRTLRRTASAGCIGPVTAAAARSRGYRVRAEARPHTIEALVQALEHYV